MALLELSEVISDSVGEPRIMMPVSGLLGARSPSDIAGFVVSVVVDSFDGVEDGRTLTNVVDEFLIGGDPFSVDGYAPATVPVKMWCVGVETPLLHGRPRPVSEARPVLTTGPTVDGYALSMEAPAAFLPPGTDVAKIHYHGLAAVALRMEPSSFRAYSVGFAGHHEPTVTLSSEVNSFHNFYLQCDRMRISL